MNRKIRTFFALFLAVAMMLSGPFSVLADPAPGELPILAEDGRVYVWNVENEVFNQDADLTEKPELEGNVKLTEFANPEGYIHPALDLQAVQEDTAFTVTGDVEAVYEYDGGRGITAVQAEKLPDFSEEEPNGKSAKAVIGGDVTASSISAADGDAPSVFAVNVRAAEGTVDVSTGNVNASAEATDDGGEYHETAFAKGVQVVANRDGESNVTVEGDINAEGKAEDGRAGAHGVSAGASGGGVVDVHVKGDVVTESEDNGAVNPAPEEPEKTADGDEALDEKMTIGSRLDYSYTNAVLIMADSGGVLDVTVDGKAKASSLEENVVAAAANVTTEDLGTRAGVTIGKGAEGQIYLTSYTDSEISLTVREGGVTSDSGKYGAVFAESDKGNIEINITDHVTGLDSETRPGYAAGMNLNAKNEGTVAAAVNGNVYAAADDAPENGVLYAESLVAHSDGGTVETAVSGNVWAVASSNGGGRADATGISAMASSQSGLPGSITLKIDGDVKADAKNTDGIAEAVGISAAALNQNTQTDIHVRGDVAACNDSTQQDVTLQFGTRAIFATAMGGGETMIQVDGKAKAEAPEDLAFTTAVDAESEGKGSTVAVQIGKGTEGTVRTTADKEAKISVTVLDGGVDAGMLGIGSEANNGSLIEVSITGDITVHEIPLDPGEAYGMSLSALDGGTVKAAVDGDITAKAETGNAVGIAAGGLGGTIETVVTGDVKATGGDYNYGIEARSTDGAKTDIIVDGTVEAGESAVVLVMPETQLGDNVTLTVWELVPNENGAVVSRKEDYESTEVTEDVEAEKAVQYIIRVRADQQNIIDTRGTEEYKGYDVAREGDAVTLLLNVPEGYRITGAYGDVDQNVQLLQDTDGNYYLVVPRGGAVELSVKMEKIGTDDGSPVLQPERTTGNAKNSTEKAEISTEKAETGRLTITDKTGKTRIAFFGTGIYTVRYADGSSENGTFTLKNDLIVLVNDNDKTRTPMTIQPNPETDRYELAFRPSADPESVIGFVINKEDVKTLYALCK